MNIKIQDLIDKKSIKLLKPKAEKERIEVFIEGDINDGDYIRDINIYSVDEFIEYIPIYKKLLTDDIEDIDEDLYDVLPSTPVDDCSIHTISVIKFNYFDSEGKRTPFKLL
jgi:hypothetical protein